MNTPWKLSLAASRARSAEGPGSRRGGAAGYCAALLMGWGLLWFAPAASGQCVSQTQNRANYGTVRLNWSTFGAIPGALAQGIADGMGAWNSSTCNSGGIAFPQFVSDPTASFDEEIELFWQDGINPADARACASFEGGGVYDGSQTAIRFFSRGRAEDGTEFDCFQNASVAADTVAHELGHYLGLGDAPTSCGSHIMAPRANPTDSSRAVQSGECQKVNELNRTPEEPAEDGESDGGGGGGGGGGEGGGGGDGGSGGSCGSGQEAWGIDCGDNGTYDYVVCLYWWEDPWEAGAEACGAT